MEMVEWINADEVNTVRPPHAQLIAELFKYNGYEELQAEEINIITEYDGVICMTLTMSTSWAPQSDFTPYRCPEKNRRGFAPLRKVDVVQRSNGWMIPRMKQMSLKIMGDFVRHDSSVIPASKAWGRRSKRVHDLYTQCEASAYSHGQASCVGQFQQSVIARGFLREGADRICHAAQLKDLSEVVHHFYPEHDFPTNKQEYKDKVRSFADIAEDPWFNQEGGLRSITALVKKIPVGDHVLLSRESGYEDPWRGGW
jgi:hypothetical protein